MTKIGLNEVFVTNGANLGRQLFLANLSFRLLSFPIVTILLEGVFQVFQVFKSFFCVCGHMCRKFPTPVDGPPSGGSSVCSPVARTPIDMSGNFIVLPMH